MYPIPADFANRMIEMCGDEGRRWLAALPATLEEYAQRWSLTLLPPFELSYNYVAPAVRADGSDVVLKMGIPNRELLSEMHALQLFDGRGIVRQLEVDFERQVMLLERLRPGETLLTVEDNDQMTRIAAQVMSQLWCPVAKDRPLLTVESWTAGLQKLRPHFGGTIGPFPEGLVDIAERLFAELISSQGERVLLHGDLHHRNILSGTRQPWLALDPKGVIGEREYETGALFRNPNLDHLDKTDLKRLQARRVDILVEMLGFDRQRILSWGVAQAVLSAWWTVEDHGRMDKATMRCAEVLYKLLETGD